MAKVKQAVVLVVGTVEGGEVRPSTTQEGVFIHSEIYLLGVNKCLRFLHDSIPSKVKEEVQRGPLGRAYNNSSKS